MHFPLQSDHDDHSDRTQSGGQGLKQTSVCDKSSNVESSVGSDTVDTNRGDDVSKTDVRHFSVDSLASLPDLSHVTLRRATPTPHSAP